MVYFLLFLQVLCHSDVTVSHEFYLHDFHLSKCEIDMNHDDQILEIAIQVFIDDMELALATMGYDTLKLCTPHEAASADDHILEYLSKHLVVDIDGTPTTLNWVGKEISDDLAGVWCYLTIENVQPNESITVRNDTLMEIFDDQRNIVRLTYDEKNKKYLLFDVNENEGSLTIK